MTEMRFRSSSRWWLFKALIFSGLALYLIVLVLKEALEGNISTSRSWSASVIFVLIAVLAGWRAIHWWRRLAERRRLEV